MENGKGLWVPFRDEILEISYTFFKGWWQSAAASVSQGLAILQGIRGQGQHMGEAAGWPWWVSDEPEPSTEEVGISWAYIRTRRTAEGTGKIPTSWWWLQVMKFCHVNSGVNFVFIGNPKWCLYSTHSNLIGCSTLNTVSWLVYLG